jgi:hypothetical protein
MLVRLATRQGSAPFAHDNEAMTALLRALVIEAHGPNHPHEADLVGELRAAFFPCRRSLFRRLEKKLHGAGKIRAHPGEHIGNAEEKGHVGFVSTGLNHSDFLIVVRRTRFRR